MIFRVVNIVVEIVQTVDAVVFIVGVGDGSVCDFVQVAVVGRSGGKGCGHSVFHQKLRLGI